MNATDWTDLDTRAQALLDAARTVLEGPATNHGGSSRSAPDSRPPIAQGTSMLTLVAQTFQDAGRGEQLLRAIHRAELQLWRAQHAGTHVPRSDAPDQVRRRLLRDWVGSAPEEVADFEPVTVAQVCRLRADLGRDPLTGRPADAPDATGWHTADERALRVQQLRAAHPHLSIRALGMLVGVSHPTVLADLARDRTATS